MSTIDRIIGGSLLAIDDKDNSEAAIAALRQIDLTEFTPKRHPGLEGSMGAHLLKEE